MRARPAIVAWTVALLSSCGGDSRNPIGPDVACNRASLAVGAEVTASVADADCRFPAASRANGNYDAYSVRLRSGEVYQVTQQATVTNDWNPYLEVLAPGGEVVATANDVFSRRDAELFLIAPVSGTYSIRAGGYAEGDRGDYRLGVRMCPATVLGTDDSATGTLATSDCTTSVTPYVPNSPADVFLVTATGVARTVTVGSSTFRPLFVVAGPEAAIEGGFFAWSSVGASLDRPAYLFYTDAIPPGTYLIIVSAQFGIIGDGTYTIRTYLTP